MQKTYTQRTSNVDPVNQLNDFLRDPGIEGFSRVPTFGHILTYVPCYADDSLLSHVPQAHVCEETNNNARKHVSHSAFSEEDVIHA